MNGQQYSFDFESIFQICFSDIVAAVCILNELTILSLLFLWLLLMLFLMLLPNVRGLFNNISTRIPATLPKDFSHRIKTRDGVRTPH